MLEDVVRRFEGGWLSTADHVDKCTGLLREVPKFSKFVHGTAFLNQQGRRAVLELPYWWAPDWKALWVHGEPTRPLPAHMLGDDSKMDDDEGASWRKETRSGSGVDLPLTSVSSALLKAHSLFLAIVTCRWPA